VGSTGRFSRSERLLDSRDFKRVSRHGRRSASRYFVLLRAPMRTAPEPRGQSSSARQPARIRLGVTVSRKVGNAVVRNYIKRSVREWFRSSRSGQEPGDLVVIARRDAARLRGAELAGALDQLLVRDAQGRDGALA
jgi:ribonuclease P protein component